MRIILTFVLNAVLNLALGLAIAALLGPNDYGRFAIGSTVSVVLAMGLFDWLRLSTTRFYGEARRSSEQDLRGTLNAAYAALSCGLVLVLGVAIGCGLDFGLGPMLLAAAVFGALSNGWFDFFAALARARFLDRTYAALVIVKNVMAIGLGVGAALLIPDPAVALAATALGAVLALLVVFRDLRDPSSAMTRATHTRLRGFMAYGIPVVVANVLFQVIILMNRSAAAATLGYAEAGRLALATDLGLRLVLAVGSAVDVLLFQLAVRTEAERGHHAAGAQLRRNAVIVVAVLALLGVGYAMVLPAFEALLVPARYQGPFGSLSLVLLPGIILFAMAQFAVNPVFQLAGRTGPVVVSALVTLAADAAGLALMPHGAGVAGIAAVHAVSLALGAVVIAAMAARRSDIIRLDADMLRILVAASLTALALWPLRSLDPWVALPLATLVGTAVYGAALVALDVLGLRAIVMTRVGMGRRSVIQDA